MSNQSSENYLDKLLNSVSDDEPGAGMSAPKPSDETPMAAIERELFGETDTPAMKTAKKEEDFLREFEEELLKDDIPNFSDDFMQEQHTPLVSDTEEAPDAMDASIDDMISHMEAFERGETSDVEPAPEEDPELLSAMPEDFEPVMEESAMEAEANQNLEQALGVFEGEPQEDYTQLPLTEDGEVDLAGIGNNDLMDILTGADDLSDLGDMLSADDDGVALDGVDEIGNFAESELAAQQKEAAGETGEEEDGKKKKKKKKREKKDGSSGGFFAKLSKLMFGEDEPEGNVVEVSGVTHTDVSQLSDENQQILRELEGAAENEASGKKAKKEKKKKEKKKKEPKPKKEKAPKPPKPPKPKKEKKPKEKDNTPPLPKGPVIAILIMVGSLFGLVLLGAKLLGYQQNISLAKELYTKESYVEAYAQLAGIDIQEKDLPMYNRLTVLAPVSAEYNTYLVFANSGRSDMALDALICAYGRYDVNRESATEYECLAEMEIVGGKIIKALLEDYDMTGEDALALYHLRTRREYTIQLHYRLQELGLE